MLRSRDEEGQEDQESDVLAGMLPADGVLDHEDIEVDVQDSQGYD